MDDGESRWQSPDGVARARYLAENYAAVFDAVAAVDALGHRLLTRAQTSLGSSRTESVVVLVLLRRLVSQYVGIRHLLEAAAVDQVKPLMRAQFETVLSIKALLLAESGGRGQTALAAAREERAELYYVEAERRRAYNIRATLDGVSGELPSGPDAVQAMSETSRSSSRA